MFAKLEPFLLSSILIFATALKPLIIYFPENIFKMSPSFKLNTFKMNTFCSCLERNDRTK